MYIHIYDFPPPFSALKQTYIETSTETAMIMASFRLFQAICLAYGGGVKGNITTAVIVSVLSTSAFSLKALYAMQLNVCYSKHQ